MRKHIRLFLSLRTHSRASRSHRSPAYQRIARVDAPPARHGDSDEPELEPLLLQCKSHETWHRSVFDSGWLQRHFHRAGAAGGMRARGPKRKTASCRSRHSRHGSNHHNFNEHPRSPKVGCEASPAPEGLPDRPTRSKRNCDLRNRRMSAIQTGRLGAVICRFLRGGEAHRRVAALEQSGS
jgi:hypothetical protein